MTDKEKVIKGIECHRKKIQPPFPVPCMECPYAEPKPFREWCMNGLMNDFYALLEEQEKRIDELEEELRLLKYGDQDILESGLRPAT